MVKEGKLPFKKKEGNFYVFSLVVIFCPGGIWIGVRIGFDLEKSQVERVELHSVACLLKS